MELIFQNEEGKYVSEFESKSGILQVNMVSQGSFVMKVGLQGLEPKVVFAKPKDYTDKMLLNVKLAEGMIVRLECSCEASGAFVETQAQCCGGGEGGSTETAIEFISEEKINALF